MKNPYCNTCPYILKKLKACSPLIFNSETITNISYLLKNKKNIIMVISSLSCNLFMLLILLLLFLKGKNLKKKKSSFVLTPIFALIFSGILKKILKIKRPEFSCSETFGMPSNHCVFITCFFLELNFFLKKFLFLKKNKIFFFFFENYYLYYVVSYLLFKVLFVLS